MNILQCCVKQKRNRQCSSTGKKKMTLESLFNRQALAGTLFVELASDDRHMYNGYI